MKSRPHEVDATEAAPVVRYGRESDVVTLTLVAPANHNAMTAQMRDALFEALANVLDDPSRPRLVLRGEGRCFSTGGYLPEFGTMRDLAQAHAIRTLRSCARLLHRLGNRAEFRLHGACVGSGIEVAAAAARRIGAPDTFIQLPELRMGLIPGAGGTVSVARAVGRQRLFWLALVQWKARQPGFLGDALADPLTGLEAALAVPRQLARREGGVLDVAMARVAASYAGALAT